MPHNAINYDKTHFYKIVCKDLSIKEIYVGHTTNFRSRKNQHKTTSVNENRERYNSPVYKFIRDNGGWENFDMILIETKSCPNKLEAEKIERKFIEELNATLNAQMPFRTQEEREDYKRNWWCDNRDRMRLMKKEKYAANREEELEKYKRYYFENIEKCKEWKNNVVLCECGFSYTNANKARHFKSQRHLDGISN